MLRDFVKPPPRDELFEIAAKFRLLHFLEIRAAGNAMRPVDASRGAEVIADPKSFFELGDLGCAGVPIAG